jgi:hypothetical protein
MNLSILLYVRKCEQGYAMEVVDTKVFTTLGSITDRVHNVVVNLTDGYNNFTPGKPVTVDNDEAIAVLNAIREAVKTHDNPGMNPFAEKWFADEAEDAYKIALMKSVKSA